MDELLTNGRNVDLVRSLVANHVRFLVVGGLAVAFYGCRELDDVDDMDLLVDPSPENTERFVAALVAAGGPRFEPLRLAKPKVQMPLKQDFYVDVLTPSKNQLFEVLWTTGSSATLNGVRVRVIGKEHLIEAKREALGSARASAEKHSGDLAKLGAA